MPRVFEGVAGSTRPCPCSCVVTRVFEGVAAVSRHVPVSCVSFCVFSDEAAVSTPVKEPVPVFVRRASCFRRHGGGQHARAHGRVRANARRSHFVFLEAWRLSARPRLCRSRARTSDFVFSETWRRSARPCACHIRTRASCFVFSKAWLRTACPCPCPCPCSCIALRVFESVATVSTPMTVHVPVRRVSCFRRHGSVQRTRVPARASYHVFS